MSFRTVAEDADSSAPDDSVFSLIDRHTTVDGALTTSYDLRVDGQVLGTLRCDGTLYVSEGAEVDATIEAGNIVVAGSASGVITCRGRLEIQSTGIVRAEVATGALVILEGAIFEGQIRMDAPVESTSRTEGAEEPSPEADEPDAYSFLRRFRGDDGEHAIDADLPAAPNDDETS